MRKGQVKRETAETSVIVDIDLDGKGKSNINTGVGFFDHMLSLVSFHSQIDMNISAKGDLDVCDHHTVEDVGIALGSAIKEALGEKIGIARYNTFFIPMDESLAMVSVDISGRPYLVFDCKFTRETIGDFSTEMVKEFFRAVAFNGGITLHCNVLYGENDHHKIEALFKAFGRSLKGAITVSGSDLPSTKGVL